MAVMPTLALMLLFGMEQRRHETDKTLERSLSLALEAGLSQELAVSDAGARRGIFQDSYKKGLDKPAECGIITIRTPVLYLRNQPTQGAPASA